MGKVSKEMRDYLMQQCMLQNIKDRPKKLAVKFTAHAIERYEQRMRPMWFTLEDVKKDVDNWWKWIRMERDNRFYVNWKIWHYIIARDKTVLTMFEYRKDREMMDLFNDCK